MNDPEISRNFISHIMKHGFPNDILKPISEYAIQCRNSDLLQISNDFWNTSEYSWELYKNRVWIHHTTKETTRKFCPILDENGQPTVNEKGEAITKQILGVKQRETAMGICLVCYHAGPVGLECIVV